MRFTYLMEAPEEYERVVRYSWRWAIPGLIAGIFLLWLQFGTEFGRNQTKHRAGPLGMFLLVASVCILVNRSPQLKLDKLGFWTPRNGFWPWNHADLIIAEHGVLSEFYVEIYREDEKKPSDKIRITYLDISKKELEGWFAQATK